MSDGGVDVWHVRLFMQGVRNLGSAAFKLPGGVRTYALGILAGAHLVTLETRRLSSSMDVPFAELLWMARTNKTWLKAAMTDTRYISTITNYVLNDYLFELGTYAQVARRMMGGDERILKAMLADAVLYVEARVRLVARARVDLDLKERSVRELLLEFFMLVHAVARIGGPLTRHERVARLRGPAIPPLEHADEPGTADHLLAARLVACSRTFVKAGSIVSRAAGLGWSVKVVYGCMFESLLPCNYARCGNVTRKSELGVPTRVCGGKGGDGVPCAARYCSRRCQAADWRDGHEAARCCRTPRRSLSDATRVAFSAAECVGELLGVVDLNAAYQRRHRSKEMTV